VRALGRRGKILASTYVIVHSFIRCVTSVDVSARHDNLVSVFRRDDCSEGLRLLADRYANRIRDSTSVQV
jgi:hypothetical protein